MTKIQIRRRIEKELVKQGRKYILIDGCLIVFCSIDGIPDAMVFEIAVFDIDRVGISFNMNNPQNLIHTQVFDYISSHCPFYDRYGVTGDLEVVYLEKYMAPDDFIKYFDLLVTDVMCFVYPYVTNPDWEEYR